MNYIHAPDLKDNTILGQVKWNYRLIVSSIGDWLDASIFKWKMYLGFEGGACDTLPALPYRAHLMPATFAPAPMMVPPHQDRN